jgi:hypothetical protein
MNYGDAETDPFSRQRPHEMVQLRPQDVGKWAIVPGPKDRMEVLTRK